MFSIKLFTFLCLASLTLAQDYEEYRPAARPAPQRYNSAPVENSTPVPILKQINKHNEDGSYTYGYEGADGSFKIETKLASGEVKGKYGYVDADGKVRVVEYGANKYGFQPSGEGITVPPPSLVDETVGKDNDYEDEPPARFAVRPKPQSAKAYKPQQKPQYLERAQPVEQEPQYYDYEQEVQQPIQVARPRPAPVAPQRPAPQQHQFQNSLDIVYAPNPRPSPAARPQQHSFFEDRQPQQFPDTPQAPPAQPRLQAQPAQVFTPAQQPRQQQFQFQPAPIPQRPAYQPQAQGRSTSVLDQLEKDFPLPNSAPALHDITFGYQGF